METTPPFIPPVMPPVNSGNQNEPHSRRPMIIVLVVLIILALGLIAWRMNWFSWENDEALTDEERAQISNFLRQNNLPVLTETEVKTVKSYLNNSSSSEMMTEEQKQDVLNYLQ